MAHKISIGLSRKDGLPQYGSIGATCHIEFEIDADPLGTDLESFHDSVRDAFTACRQAVHDELARYKAQHHAGTRSSNGNGHSNGHPNGNASSNRTAHANPAYHVDRHSRVGGDPGADEPRQATPKQLAYARQLGSQIEGLGAHRVESLARHLYGIALPELSSHQASGLIDTLKEIKGGRLELSAAFNEAVG